MVEPQVNSKRMHTQQPDTCRKYEFKFGNPIGERNISRFLQDKKVGKMTSQLFTAECRYDDIIGRDMLTELELILDFKTHKMSWDDCHVPMRPFPSTETKRIVPGQRPEPTPVEQLYLDIL